MVQCYSCRNVITIHITVIIMIVIGVPLKRLTPPQCEKKKWYLGGRNFMPIFLEAH